MVDHQQFSAVAAQEGRVQVDIQQRRHGIVGIGRQGVERSCDWLACAGREAPHLDVPADVVDHEVGRQTDDAVDAGGIVADKTGRCVGWDDVRLAKPRRSGHQTMPKRAQAYSLYAKQSSSSASTSCSSSRNTASPSTALARFGCEEWLAIAAI